MPRIPPPWLHTWYTVMEKKPISLFCWNETKSSLSAKSGLACFKNVCLLSVSWKEPCWCFALRRCASTINLLSLFTKQTQILQTNSPLGVEVNSEAYWCSIHRIFEEFGCLTLGMISGGFKVGGARQYWKGGLLMMSSYLANRDKHFWSSPRYGHQRIGLCS